MTGVACLWYPGPKAGRVSPVSRRSPLCSTGNWTVPLRIDGFAIGHPDSVFERLGVAAVRRNIRPGRLFNDVDPPFRQGEPWALGARWASRQP